MQPYECMGATLGIHNEHFARLNLYMSAPELFYAESVRLSTRNRLKSLHCSGNAHDKGYKATTLFNLRCEFAANCALHIAVPVDLQQTIGMQSLLSG
jgi:hypothetical protein